MDNTNKNTNTENLIPKLKTPTIFYILAFGILILIIIMFLIFFNVNLTSKPSKSQQETIAETLIILFFVILIVGLCILFLPSLKDFKELFSQIGNVTYVILYTIFTILIYTMMPKDILNNYSYIINPVMLGLGALSFYKSTTQNYIEKFNIGYERIKMLILLFCLITLIITFYNINPGGAISKYFGYTLLLTIIISVFAFLYVIILMTMPGDKDKPQQNLLSNFSSFGTYGTILFIIFLVVITILISSNRESFFGDQPKAATVIILLLIICILWSVLLGVNLFSDSTNNLLENNKMNLFKKSLLILFGIVISGLVIYWITYNIESLSSDSSIVSFILNLLLVIIILGLIYKTINVNLPAGNTKKNAFFNLIGSTIFYIPCLVSGLFDSLGGIAAGQYNSTTAGSLIMLVLAIILVVVYFKAPSLFNTISTQGGEVLVNKPVYTSSLYNLASYQDLNKSDNFNYQYGISFWVFLDAMPPNTNSNYNKFTSLLNFGNKPNISYNGKTNTLMVTMQQKDLKKNNNNKFIDFDSEGNRIIYVNKNVLLQKWNNIIINYNGGTMDVFLNGELVKSSVEVVPYYTFDTLTIGENDGIKGGICNVIYFRRALSSTNIYYLYNTVKNKNPPVLNDSNETIMKNNYNTVTNSVKTVT
jgi:cytochrome bd-type quinol oxidase subunit 2